MVRHVDPAHIRLFSEPRHRAVAEGEIRRFRDADEGIRALREYRENKEDASIVLTNGEAVAVLPYTHRWTAEYAEKMGDKIDAAEHQIRERYGSVGPVTVVEVSPRRFTESGEPRALSTVFGEIEDEWARLRRKLPARPYLRVLYPDDIGYPTMKVVCFGRADVGETAYMNVSQACRSVRSKLTRTIARPTGDFPDFTGFEVFAAYLWATGTRQFSTSRGLTTAAEPAGQITLAEFEASEWRFLGVGFGIPYGEYEGEEAQKVKDHISDGPWRPPPSKKVYDGGLPV